MSPRENHPINIIEDLQFHPCRNRDYGLEEVYALVIMVAKDLYLGEKEMAIWWVILEEYGFDSEYELLRTLYYSAYAAKETLNYVGIIDAAFVESNFMEDFQNSYKIWSFHKNFARALRRASLSFFKAISSFLNKHIDYNALLETMHRDVDTQGIYTHSNGGYDGAVDDLVDTSAYLRYQKLYHLSEEPIDDGVSTSDGMSNSGKDGSPLHQMRVVDGLPHRAKQMHSDRNFEEPDHFEGLEDILLDFNQPSWPIGEDEMTAGTAILL